MHPKQQIKDGVLVFVDPGVLTLLHGHVLAQT
jgi:hypothetical protein